MATAPRSQSRSRQAQRRNEHPRGTERVRQRGGVRDGEPVREITPAGAGTVDTPVAPDEPRIVGERHCVGPEGQEASEVVDEHGRRFWSFRPTGQYRYGYDWLGFGWFWWLIFWVVVIGLIVWGWGWGW